eukprot:gene7930-13823_t
MSPERFEHLLQLVGPYMQIKQCRSREPISNAERLALTIRYLASGDSQQSVSFNFRAFNANEMNIPSPTIVDGHELQYVILSDEILALKPWLLKPLLGKGLTNSQAVFNYRLSRARRTIENYFGILAARWHIFRRPIRASPEVVDQITACACLHNYLRLTNNPQYLPSGFTDTGVASGNIVAGDWRTEVHAESSE